LRCKVDQSAPLLQGTQEHAVGKLGRVLEQRVAPGGAVAVFVDAVGHAGGRSAPDGRAAGGVADDHALAEQLGDEFGVRRFAAAGTGAGELEQGLAELAALDRVALGQVVAHRQAGGIAVAGPSSIWLSSGFITRAGFLAGQMSAQLPQPMQSRVR
jgi:hypothetical protein